jgi:hypothetical protein
VENDLGEQKSRKAKESGEESAGHGLSPSSDVSEFWLTGIAPPLSYDLENPRNFPDFIFSSPCWERGRAGTPRLASP